MAARHFAAALLIAAWAFIGPAAAIAPTFLTVLPASAPMNHAPTLAELSPGHFLACWYSGSEEAAPDVVIACAKSDDDGHSWRALAPAVHAGETGAGASQPNKTLGNPVLYGDAQRLWLIYGVVQTRPSVIGNVCRNWTCGRIDAQVSSDGGATWSKGARLIDLPGALPRAPMRVVDGHPLLPAYLEGPRTGFVATLALDGRSAHVAGLTPQIGPSLIQPALVPAGAGVVRAYFRDRRAQWIYTATMDVAHGQWSTPVATNLPNPDAAIDTFAMGDGRIALIYNPSTAHRAALALATTADGAHFDRDCTLADGPGDVAYPTALFARGALSVVYSARGKHEIRFARFDPATLAACAAQALP